MPTRDFPSVSSDPADRDPTTTTGIAPALAGVRTVAVGSTNPVKVAAARAVFARVAPLAVVRGVPVGSGVPDQPWGDIETRRGAATRAVAARTAGGADLGVGLEGGVVEEGPGIGGEANGEPEAVPGLRTCAWAAVVDGGGGVHLGGSLAMPLPEVVAARVRAGEELGHAMDALLDTIGTKHGGGAVGVLTRGLVDRQQAYEAILTYALAPLLAPALGAGAPGVPEITRGP